MGFEYNINTSINDKRSGSCLFGCHALSSVINLFVSTFLVGYIYSFNGNVYDYIFNVSVYNIAIHVAYALVYLPISYFVDRSNRIWFYRFGLVLRVVLVVLFIFLGKQLAQHLVIAGVVNGVSDAFYYSSYNVLRQEMVSRKVSGNYSAWIYIVSKLIEIVCPIILGTLIDRSTYSQVAMIVLVICIAQIVLSMMVKAQRPNNSRYDLRGFFKKIKTNSTALSKIKIIYFICAIYGASLLANTVLNVCIMINFQSTFSLGTLTSIFSIVSILIVFLSNKFTKPGKRSWMFVVCSVIIVLAGVCLMFEINSATIIIFNASYAIVSIIFKYLFDMHRNGILKESGLYSEVSEYHTMVEIIVAVSRAFCFALLLAVSMLHSMLAFKTYLLINCCVLVFVLIALLVFERKFLRVNKLSEEGKFKKIMKILLTKD